MEMGSMLSVFGTGFEVLGALAEGSQAEAAGQANANILRGNASQVVVETGMAKEAMNREQQTALGRQRAAIAQAGGGFGGSASDVGRRSAAEAELDLLNTQYEGDMRRRGLLAQARIEEWQGKQAKKMGYLKATSALVKGGVRYGMGALL